MADDVKLPVDPNFPRHLHKADGSVLVVTNSKDQDKAVKAGWLLLPPPPPVAEPDPAA